MQVKYYVDRLEKLTLIPYTEHIRPPYHPYMLLFFKINQQIIFSYI